jgi:hypothetical protein
MTISLTWRHAEVQSCLIDSREVVLGVHKKKIQQDATMYQNFIISYVHVYEAQHVSGDAPPIIRSPILQ